MTNVTSFHLRPFTRPARVRVRFRGLATSEAPPPECCLYPWPDPGGTPFYPPEDLPDFLDIVDGTGVVLETLAHDVGDYTYSGTNYNVRAGTSFWEIQSPVSTGPWEGFGGCLIRDDVAHDEFDDTYTVDTTTLTRTSQCQWEGDGRVLRYNSTTYKFELDGVAKAGDQNKPDGTYGAETVS